MSLRPLTKWQMVDYPNTQTNYLGFPSVPGHRWEPQRPSSSDPPTVGQLALSATHTHTPPSPRFPASFSSFLPPSHFSLSTFTRSSSAWQSLSQRKHKTTMGRGFVSTQCTFMFRLRLSAALSCGWFEVCRWAYFDWFSSPSIAPYRTQCNYEEGQQMVHVLPGSIVGKTIKMSETLPLVLPCFIFRGDAYKVNLV